MAYRQEHNFCLIYQSNRATYLAKFATPLNDVMPVFSSKKLSTGWEFKLAGDPASEEWLPVAKVPSVVHLDLVANGKCVNQ